VVLIAVLIRWSLAARSAPDAESLVWLSGAEDLAAEKSESHTAAPTEVSVPPAMSESSVPEEREKEQPPLPQARSEIELPKPTPMETPVPKATTKPKTTTRPIPKSTPKKVVLAKASKSSVHFKPTLSKFEEEADSNPKKSVKSASAKTASSPQSSAAKTGSAGKDGGHSGGGSSESEFGWYGNMLHDRFYSAWVQPTTTVASGVKISTLVKVRIEKDGRVSKFDIIKPSENVVVNESVAAIAKQVTEVDPPPAELGNGNHYDVKINFELNTRQ
jgi:outer membrane biosynthesis protein TonB